MYGTIGSSRSPSFSKHSGLFYIEVGYERLGQTLMGAIVLGRVIGPHTLGRSRCLRRPTNRSTTIMMRRVLSRVNPGDYGHIIGDAGSVEALL